MKNRLLFSVLLLGLMAFKSINADVTEADSKVNWLTIEEAEQLNTKEPKKILVFFYTDWCGVCKQMEKTVFQSPSVVQQLNENYYPVRFNAEQKQAVTFDGIDYDYIDSESGNGINGLANDMLLGQKVMPTLVFLDENKTTVRRLVGMQPTDLFSLFLSYISDDAYLTQEWFQYSGQED